MRSCFDEDELLALATGERPVPDDAGAEGHLADCATCASVVARLAGAAWLGEDGATGASVLGRTLGPYRVERLIGAGGMGEVYRAWDERLGRAVALKVLPAGLAASPAQVRRLEREARAAATITHPNVVTVHDVSSAGGVTFVVSELIEGESLRSLLDRGAVGGRALALGRQLVRGVAAAHAREVVHRDLNPRNVLVTAEGVVKILDFGLAKLPRLDHEPLDETTPGTVMGTMGYLAPEQARGEAADARSDLFAVGAILYEMVTGERAFAGDTAVERLSSLLRDTPPRLSDGSLGALGGILARCLERDPARRFQSAEDLGFVLDGLDGEAPARPRFRRRALLAGALGAGLGIAGGRWLWRGGERAPRYRALTYRRGRVTLARATGDGSRVVLGAAWDDQGVGLTVMRLADGGEEAVQPAEADLLAVSSRGELALSLDRRFVRGMHAAGRLVIASLSPMEPRVVADEVQDADFAPDGSLALVRRTGDGFQVEWPPGTIIHRAEGTWLSDPRVSPDGRQLACLEHPDVTDDRGAVIGLTRDGARRVLSDEWSSLAGLAWGADGEVWFGGARTGDGCAVHAVTPGGAARRIAEIPGRLRLHDRLRDGSALITQDHRRLVLRVGRRGGEDRDVSLSDVSVATALSADGTMLLCGELGGGAGIRHGAYLRRLAGGPPLRVGDGAPLSLSADGRRALVLLLEPATRLVAHALDGAPPRDVPLGDIASLRWARFAGEGIVLGGAAAGRPPRLWRSDGRSAPRPISDEGIFGRGWASLDGAAVALVVGPRLLRIPVDGGAPSVVAGEFSEQIVCGWHANGKEVFLRRTPSPWRLERVELATGARVPHGEIIPPPLGRKGLDATVISADGELWAYSHGEELSRLFLLDWA